METLTQVEFLEILQLTFDQSRRRDGRKASSEEDVQ
jgi:hypothetical protein